MSKRQLRVVFVGAHPDDPDICCGGTAIRFLEAGHVVKYLSMTNGDVGHQSMSGHDLAIRRRLEAAKVADYLGLEYHILNTHDTMLEPSVENRYQLIRILRRFAPDLIITHRPNDYHADHRNTSTLVQDAAYLLSVPNVCPDTPRLEKSPVIMYQQDNFQKPLPFEPEVFIDITPVVEKKYRALALHESQIFEWLPFIEGYLDTVPKERGDEAWKWVRDVWSRDNKAVRFTSELQGMIPEEQLKEIEYIEAFEACEYGCSLTRAKLDELFPFRIKA